MARTGRPLVIDPKVVTAACDRVEKGVPPEVALMEQGVPRSTAYAWLARAEEAEAKRDRDEKLTANDSAALDLLDAVTRARAKWEADALVAQHEATTGGKEERPDPRPRQWALERSMPEKYGQKLTLAVQEEAAEFLVKRLAAKSPELAAQVAAVLREDPDQ